MSEKVSALKQTLLVLGGILVGLLIIASAFLCTAVVVGYLYLTFDKVAARDGQAGIPALILGVIVGIPAALCAGYFWLQYSLGRLLKLGIIPNQPHS